MTQIPAGYLIQRFGAKVLLTVNMIGTAMCTMVLPLTALHGVVRALTHQLAQHGPTAGRLAMRWLPYYTTLGRRS